MTAPRTSATRVAARHGAWRVAGIAVLLVLAAGTLASCRSGSSYEVTARFARAVALYADSDVKVMGVTVGRVSDIEIDGDGILVTMSIDEGVPLPADVRAAIEPVSLIGERNVVLGPAWRSGQPKLADGGAIPVERTLIPVEPDEALQAVTDLVQALDPRAVDRLLSEAAGALDGNGRTINEVLAELADLVPYLAEQDDELLAIAADVRRIAAVVERRDRQIGELLDDFAAVSGVLAEEREAIVGFLDALVSLTRQGEALLTAYEVSLPEDLETLATVALSIQVNAGAVQQLIAGLESLNDAVIDAYDPASGSLRARVVTSRSGAAPLAALLEALGLPVPCAPDTECTP